MLCTLAKDYACVGASYPVPLGARGHGTFYALWLLLLGSCIPVIAPAPYGECPECHGNFMTCNFNNVNACVGQASIVSNRASVVAKGGALDLSKVVNPLYLKVFFHTELSQLFTLINRPVPGASVVVDATTSVSTLVSCIQAGQMSLESALSQLYSLMEAETDAPAALKLKVKIDMVATIVKNQGVALLAGGANIGILTFILYRVSEFVHRSADTVRLWTGDLNQGGGSALSAKLHRPTTMEACSQIFNLFILLVGSLGVLHYNSICEFFQKAFYATINLRNRSWKVAFELVLVMLNRVEDSGGAITVSTVVNDVHMNSCMEEAEAKATFFRPLAGNANSNASASGGATATEGTKPYNGKFSGNPAPPCVRFNSGQDHPATAQYLHLDGTCKFNHVCDKWVTNKGKFGRCLCSEGAKGHARKDCDNPHRSEEKITK